MPMAGSESKPDSEKQNGLPLNRQEPPLLNSGDFQDSFNEDLQDVLDVTAWKSGFDPFQEFARIEGEVREAVEQETELQRRTRAEIFPKLFSPANSVPHCGVYEASPDVLRLVHRGLLFNGGVEACDGTVQVHDTLPLTIYQIGVSLVSYRGDQGTWHQRLFRRDLRQSALDPVEEALEALERRHQRSALNHSTPGDQLGELARKTVMDYAERAILLKRSDAVWRVGHGNPITYELLTGAGIFDLMVASTSMLRELMEGHRKFLFVASEPRERFLLTIGQALRGWQYAVVCTLDTIVENWFHQQRFKDERELSWDGEPIAPSEWIPHFLEKVASQVVVGVYRASALAPAHLFYAHADHVHLAAHIAIADSMLQVERGFPLLIDLAHHVCKNVFSGSLDYLTETAYNSAGAPYRYLSERTTRSD